MKKVSKHAHSIPALETLESRTLLSGNVLVALSGGNLNLTGDAYDNLISIRQNGDTVTVIPDANTSLNGGAPGDQIDFTGVTKSINIKLFDGDDSVDITGQNIGGTAQPFLVGATGAGGLKVDLGDGNDSFTLRGVQAGKVALTTGEGTNTVDILALDPDGVLGGPGDISATIGTLNVKGASGDEDMHVSGVTIGKTTLALAGGWDTIHFSPFNGSDNDFDLVFTSDLTVTNAGTSSNDIVDFDDVDDVGVISVAGNLKIGLGLGDGEVTATTLANLTVGKNMQITTGKTGRDDISLADVEIGGNLAIKTNNGSDFVELLGVQVGGNSTVQTGAGVDSIVVDGGTTHVQTTVTKASKLDGGADDDTVTVANATFGSSQANGGKGIDELIIDDLTVTVLGTEKVTGFEL